MHANRCLSLIRARRTAFSAVLRAFCADLPSRGELLPAPPDGRVVLGAAGKVGHGVGRGLEAEVLAVRTEIGVDYGVGGDVAVASVHFLVVGEEHVVFGKRADFLVVLAFGSEEDGVFQNVADVRYVVLAERERFGKFRLREDGGVVALFVFFEQLRRFVQM